MSLQYPDDPTEYMAALGPIAVVGTSVGAGSVFIEKGVAADAATWPVLQLTCPRTVQRQMTINAGYQATFDIYGAYMDKWETGARSFEQALADAKAALYRMARNIRLQPDLGLTYGVQAHIVRADQEIEIRVNNTTTDLGLGFPLVTGTFMTRVTGPWFLPS